MTRKPCIEACCGVLTNKVRCPAHERVNNAKRWAAKDGRYNGDWRTRSKQAIADHIAEHGHVCPGWDRPPHPTDRFVCDHDLGPMCVGCNAVKAATFDKRRARSSDHR